MAATRNTPGTKPHNPYLVKKKTNYSLKKTIKTGIMPVRLRAA